MSSTEQTRPTSQQQQRRVASSTSAFPSIKIFTPPQGQFSPKTDEWCISYCSQSVRGRLQEQDPNCRSVCIRKVFPHEVRNIVSFKSHRSVGADGKAKYPLPDEGQAVNLPRFLGGSPVDDSDTSNEQLAPTAVKHWDEGYYLWMSKGRWAAFEKTAGMKLNLEKQSVLPVDHTKELLQDYQEHLKQRTHSQGVEKSSPQVHENSEGWFGSIVPSRPKTDLSQQSLLVRLPPEFPPFWDRINKLLAPSHRALSIFRESISSGEQKEFAQRVWEKAWTDEPYILASRTFSGAYERWKRRDEAEEDDSKKGST